MVDCCRISVPGLEQLLAVLEEVVRWKIFINKGEWEVRGSRLAKVILGLTNH
jgi:hypothetical protein